MFQPTIATTNKTKNYNSKKKQSSSQSSNNDDVEWSQSQFDVDGDNSQDHNGKPPKEPEVSFITPVDAVLQALQEHIRRNVRRNVQTKSGKRNGFGLALFGTRKRTRVDIDELLAANRDKRRFGKQKQTKKDDDDNSLVEEEEAEKKKKDSDEDSDSDDSDDDDDDMHPKSNRASGRTTIHHLIALEPPGVDTVKILRQCLMPDNNEQQEEEDRRMLDLKHLFGHKPQKHQDDDFLSDSLLIALNDITGTFKDAEKNGGCVHKLRTPAEKIGNDKKCIWIVTNQDDFCKRDPERQRIIQTTVQDLRNNGFEIKGWPLPPPTGKRSAVAARKESCFFDKIADIPDDLRQMLQRAMKGRRSSSSSGENKHYYYDLQDIDDVLSGHWKTIRKSLQVPLLFPDQVPFFLQKLQPPTNQQDNTGSIKQEDVENDGDKMETDGDKKEGEEEKKDDGEEEEEDTKQQLAPSITLDFFTLVSLQKIPTGEKIKAEIGKDEKPVELVSYSYKQTMSGEILAKFKSKATDEEKEQERQQPGLARIRKFHALKTKEIVPIKVEEVVELKKQSNATEFRSLTLLGFKKPEKVPLHMNLKSYFVYPNEDAIEGSTAAFAHLHQAMLKKKVVGIGELLVRHSATSRLVAIQAMEEVMDRDNGDGDSDDESEDEIAQLYPPGWIVTYLPFENEVRTIPPDKSTNEEFDVPDDVVQAATAVLATMRLDDFDISSGFKSGHLEKFWDYIESVAEETALSPSRDYCIQTLSEDALDVIRGPVSELKDALPEDPVEPPKKRKAAKLEASDDTDWAKELREGNLDRYTVSDLKLGCETYGIPKSGKKAALIERLSDAIRGGEDA
ncbi:helicase 2 subunit KU70 [Seminavis robusta]|uniref:Helicase 2 subunit KU70 n=1 Tax=Seminavis robusta TaxID=568900 RepID=A0A9N8ECS6_9STRA|nr:helicase 2 subunit KU70 [Seminavis robusta]|eukprot:Sro764_g199000.1 helicase 2 subunit KU70 (844) ;mRNA; f:1581-4392